MQKVFDTIEKLTNLTEVAIVFTEFASKSMSSCMCKSFLKNQFSKDHAVRTATTSETASFAQFLSRVDHLTSLRVGAFLI